MTKYIDADCLRKLVEEKYNSKDTVGDKWDLGYDTACEQILDIIDSLRQEQIFLPSDLDEAVKEYAPDFSNDFASKAAVEAMRESFKAGVEWVMNQLKENKK